MRNVSFHPSLCQNVVESCCVNTHRRFQEWRIARKKTVFERKAVFERKTVFERKAVFERVTYQYNTMSKKKGNKKRTPSRKRTMTKQKEILLLHGPEIMCPRVLMYVFQELTHAFGERGYEV